MLSKKGTDDEAKAHDGKVQAIIQKASLFVRNVVVTEKVKLSFERALVETSAFSLRWKFEQKFHQISRSKVFCDRKRVWNGANQKVNFVYGQKSAVLKYSSKLFAFFIPKVQKTACRNPARERGALGWDTNRHEQQC